MVSVGIDTTLPLQMQKKIIPVCCKRFLRKKLSLRKDRAQKMLLTLERLLRMQRAWDDLR